VIQAGIGVEAPVRQMVPEAAGSLPLIMGILNTTPDSFSDGGRYLDPDRAFEHALRMRDEGADLIDIGGESSRPGARPVPAEEELRRVLPVIRRLRVEVPELQLSIDTRKPRVAEAALDAGVGMVNDIGGGGPEMLRLVAAGGASIVLMHMRGEPATMQEHTTYASIVEEVHAFLLDRAEAALQAGIPASKIYLDPGIGFGKDDAGNLALLRSLPELAAAGFPLLVGTSRKSFIGRLSGAEPSGRLPGSLASLLPVLGLEHVICRVHDVQETLQFFRIATLLGPRR